MNITTILGLLMGAAALIAALLLEEGELASFANLPAMLVVFGGTMAATLIAFPGSAVARLPGVIGQTFFHRAPDSLSVARTLVRLSERARREGLLALEEELKGIENSLLKRGVMLVIDGTDQDLVRSVLQSDTYVRHHRHEGEVQILEAMGGFAPTMGIIGTVMGLVNVLGRLDDPTKLGHAISVAFIATFYGVASANLLWLPMASKLKKQGETDQMLDEMILEGLASIQSGENPRVLQERLEPYLPKTARGHPLEEQDTDGARARMQEELRPGQA